MKNIKWLILIGTVLNAIELPNSFCADFNQTISSDKKNLTYKGEIFYKNKDIVWKYTYPYNKIIWIEDKIYIYEPDLMQVTIMKRKNTLNEILKKAKKLKDSLYKTTYKNKDYFLIIKKKKLKELFYKDEMGNNIKITFKYKKNCNFNVFKINLPKNTEYIYENN